MESLGSQLRRSPSGLNSHPRPRLQRGVPAFSKEAKEATKNSKRTTMANLNPTFDTNAAKSQRRREKKLKEKSQQG